MTRLNRRQHKRRGGERVGHTRSGHLNTEGAIGFGGARHHRSIAILNGYGCTRNRTTRRNDARHGCRRRTGTARTGTTAAGTRTGKSATTTASAPRKGQQDHCHKRKKPRKHWKRKVSHNNPRNILPNHCSVRNRRTHRRVTHRSNTALTKHPHFATPGKPSVIPLPRSRGYRIHASAID